MIKIRFAAVCAICTMLLCGCTDNGLNSKQAEWYVFAMDTEMTLRAYGKNAEKTLEEAESEIKTLNAALARGDAGSEIYRINVEHGGEIANTTV